MQTAIVDCEFAHRILRRITRCNATWIHGINSEIHHYDYSLFSTGLDTGMKSLNQIFYSCVRVNFLYFAFWLLLFAN